jgi:hypothetical protein
VSPLPWLNIYVAMDHFTILSPLPWLFHFDKWMPMFS